EMATHGIEDASLDAICARAGFTRGAFYVHFRDRDDLVVAVIDRVLSHTQQQVLATGDRAAGDLRQTIVRFVGRIVAGDPVAVGTASWRFRRTLAACARVPAVRERYLALQARSIELLAETVAAGQRAGSVRGDVAARQVAELLAVVSLGIS